MKHPLPVRFALAAFDRWEAWSTLPLEAALGSAKLTGPAGAWLSFVARSAEVQRRWLRTWWDAWGIASREEQEHVLHTLNDLQSRLYDLEDQIEDLREAR